MNLKSVAVFVCLLALGSAGTVQGAITCTTADYAGTYAFYTTGSLLQLPPAGAILVGPFAQSGTFTSDGQGNLIIDSTASYNGLVLPASVPGSYTITPDCIVTYSLTLPFPLSVPSQFTGYLADRNRVETVMITDPPGSVVVGRHVKQDNRFCSVSDFTGAYQIDLSGVVAAPKEQAGLFQRLGRLVSDGKGGFTSKSTGNYAGRYVTEEFSGTYDLTARCGLTLTYSFGGTTHTINGFLGGHGESAMVMVTTNGWAVSGQLRAQQ